jgi:pyridoxal phosphate enzyme (YggS family)
MNRIPERLARVRQRIHDAALASGRDPAEIALLAVSKTKPVEDVRAACEAGQRRFGENYLQDALPKIAALADADIEWHYIGRIQGNKTAEISRHFAWVHSLASQRHAELLSRHRPEDLPALQVCLQVNLSGEASKGGVDVADLGELAAVVDGLPHLRLRGLMTMPDPQAPTERQDADFVRLRELLGSLRADGIDVDTLSMGMSGDLERAIAAGSTMVRIGTDIFGPRD